MAGNSSGPNNSTQTIGSDTTAGIFVVSSVRAFDLSGDEVVTPGEPYTLSVAQNHSSGPYVDLLAMGYRVSVASDPRFGYGGYRVVWGTSQSAPLLAGVIGNMLSISDCLRPEDIERILESTACTDLDGYDSAANGAGLMDQAAAMNKAREFALGAAPTGNGPLVISTPTTWIDQFESVTDGIVIEEGGSLYIQNSRVVFGEGAYVDVKSGGGIEVWNSTLTHHPCANGEWWFGITLDGNGFRRGWTSGRPYGILNHATIEHARTGIADHGFPQPITSNGGSLHIQSSKFINNLTGVSLYRSDDPTGAPAILNSRFYLDDDFPHASSNPPLGITAALVDPALSVVVAGCKFADHRAGGGDAYGINAFDASLVVGDDVDVNGTNNGSTSFGNLRYGVYAALGGLSARQLSVRNVKSVNTLVSVWATGYDGPQIVNNDFEAGATDPSFDRFGAVIRPQGIRLEQCRAYVVEGNTVTGGNSDLGDTYGVAVISSDLATTRDVIYRNTFRGLDYGAWSEGDNGGGPLIGLCYECNTFEDCDRDVESRVGSTLADLQLGINNGSRVAAGNAFDSDIMQFAARGNTVNYYATTQAQAPDPRFNVLPRLNEPANACLPIFGIGPPQEPHCDETEVDFTELATRVTALEQYYSNTTASASEEHLTVDLTEQNRDLRQIIRRVTTYPVDGTTECSNYTPQQWEDGIITGSPWEPIDRAVYVRHVGNADVAASELWNLGAPTTEIDALQKTLRLSGALMMVTDESEADAAFAAATLSQHFGASELGMAFGETYARATARWQGTADYEARLSDAAEPNQALRIGQQGQSAIASQLDPMLHDAVIVDVAGRVVVRMTGASPMSALLAQPRINLAPGLYYLVATTEAGEALRRALVLTR